MSVLLFIIEFIIAMGMVVGLYQKNTNKFCKSKNRYDGKTVLVTGGTAGMGLEISTDFARRGARVIVACPFQHEGATGKAKIIQRSGNENVVFKLLDLASLDSVRKFAADILKTEDRLDILVNNSGVAPTRDYLTPDGINFTMQVNYFGAFLLTLLLLPLLRKSGTASKPSRIVNTISILHRIGQVKFDTWNLTGYWYKVQIYGNSKVCLALFTRELSRRMKDCNIVVNSIDPGAVGTKIFQKTVVTCGSLVSTIISVIFKQPWEGAQTALYVATSHEAGKSSGEFYKNCELSRAAQLVYDDNLAARVWEESKRLVKMSEQEYNQCFSC